LRGLRPEDPEAQTLMSSVKLPEYEGMHAVGRRTKLKATQAKTKPTRLTAFTIVDEHAGGLLAYFRATRARIMQAFGPPNSKTSDKWKISSEWNLKTPKGELVNIYDWREDYTERGWKQRKYVLSEDPNECQRHNQIEMNWHLQCSEEQPSATEEVGEALGVQIDYGGGSTTPPPPKPRREQLPEPPKGMREHEAATRRLAEIVGSDGLATGVFKLPVGDRNPVTLGVNEDDYRRVIQTPYKENVDVFERPSGRHRLLRWADYGKSGVVGLIFVDREDDLTGQMYPILWEGEVGVRNPQR